MATEDVSLANTYDVTVRCLLMFYPNVSRDASFTVTIEAPVAEVTVVMPLHFDGLPQEIYVDVTQDVSSWIYELPPVVDIQNEPAYNY